jgi:hypothetical protein
VSGDMHMSTSNEQWMFADAFSQRDQMFKKSPKMQPNSV